MIAVVVHEAAHRAGQPFQMRFASRDVLDRPARHSMLAETVHFHPTSCPFRSMQWAAIFDSYDGTEDSGQQWRIIGTGPTRFDALVDLLMQCEEADELPAWVRSWP